MLASSCHHAGRQACCTPTHASAAGSGKTHTLLGDVGSSAGKGLVTRAVNELAQGIAEDQDGCDFQVRCHHHPYWSGACATPSVGSTGLRDCT